MKPRQPVPDADESRAAVALTVAWMLTCMATAAAMFVVLALRLLMLAVPVAAGGVHPLARMTSLFVFVALLTGVLCLVLTPLVYRTRKSPPPRAVTIGAVLIGVAPIVLAIVLAIAGR